MRPGTKSFETPDPLFRRAGGFVSCFVMSYHPHLGAALGIGSRLHLSGMSA